MATIDGISGAFRTVTDSPRIDEQIHEPMSTHMKLMPTAEITTTTATATATSATTNSSSSQWSYAIYVSRNMNPQTINYNSTISSSSSLVNQHNAYNLYAPNYPYTDDKSISDYIDQLYNRTTSTCDKGYLSDRDDLSSTYYQITVYMLYISIFVIALLGNGVVCYIVHSSPRMKTVTNYFIVNLAVGDVLMSLFCVPFSFVSILLLQYWPFGSLLCHLVNYSQAVSVLVSAYTLVAISVDRYIAILWPLRPRITKR